MALRNYPKMPIHVPLLQWLLVLLITTNFTTSLTTTPSPPQVKTGCPETCGNVTIPYPFGTKEGCYLDSLFFVNCTQDSSGRYTPRLSDTVRILSISVDGHIRIASSAGQQCYSNGAALRPYIYWLTSGGYYISYKQNKFIAIGCDTLAVFYGNIQKQYITACASLCNNMDSITNGSCSGTGCCENSIPEGVKDFNMTLNSFNNHTYVKDFNPCSYAFVAENGFYNFSSLDLTKLQTIQDRQIPIVLDWYIGNQTCDVAKKDQTSYACKDQNSFCIPSEYGKGYGCNCSEGFYGNPYLGDGCKDINECEDANLNNCISPSHCKNTVGNYTCFCPKGRGDGYAAKDRIGCIDDALPLTIKIGIGISMAVSVVLACILAAYFGYHKRNIHKRREKFFKENGGLMLRQMLSKIEHNKERAKIFSEDELKKATNNFNESNIVGKGGFGTVYRGTLDNNTEIAIKVSKLLDTDQIDQFINEMIVLSQIDHPNVVKLIGCCLETRVPMLVYEFITNGTLYHHLHYSERISSMPWETRLRIAMETASALAYMHSDAPMHIIHRDVKTANILLEDNFTAKVSDFGASRLVPLDQTQLSTLVQGTLGYIDPEYFHSGLLNEKSDVYSFGVVLVELLTGEKAVSADRPEKEKNLAMLFSSAMKDNRLFNIVDQRVKNETGQAISAQVVAVARIAERCLRFNGAERPTMKEVKAELQEVIIKAGNSLHAETIPYNQYSGTGTSSSPPSGIFYGNTFSIEPDSFDNRALLQLPSAR